MLPSTSGRVCAEARVWTAPTRCPCRLQRPPHRAAAASLGNSSSSSCASSSSRSSSGGGTGRTRARNNLVVHSSQQEAAQSQSKEELQQALKTAIASEDYATAARLKEQIREIESQDPLTSLQWALDAAIAEERYADAAQIRDQLKQIADANKPQPPDLQGLTTSSDTVTGGVRVKVRSFYVPAQSRPELGQYFFAYSVSISNEGDKVVMLERRHWVITDGSGKLDHVRGPGVVGEQPILQPGKSFEYQSACPLYTTFGTMEGEYEMVVLNDQGEWEDRLEVKIGRFALIKPDMA